MKKIAASIIFCLFSFSAIAQDASVEKSTFGIQVGFLGGWVHHEARLSNQLVLRTELGLDVGVVGNALFTDGPFSFMAPVLTVEPRWYYNLNKRVRKGRRISGNSGNFISLQTNYYPDWFLIAPSSNAFVPDQITIIPTWGIRRNIGKHFTYEAGFGIGYHHQFKNTRKGILGDSDVAANLHIRIGYRF